MRKIEIVVGSESDLTQCERGFRYLEEVEHERIAFVPRIRACSIHRHTSFLLQVVLPELKSLNIDVLIAGAGWANHLTGTAEAYLRNELLNLETVVLGVAFEDKHDYRHTHAAILGVTEVPGSQVIFDNYVGECGFLKACKDAVEKTFPKPKQNQIKPHRAWTLEDALKEIQRIKGGT